MADRIRVGYLDGESTRPTSMREAKEGLGKGAVVFVRLLGHGFPKYLYC